MALNLDALIRYLEIDKRIRKNPHPTLPELKEAIECALDGRNVSLRSVQLDLQHMRYHQGLAFNAPICTKRICKTTIYYYEDSEYSLIKDLELRQKGMIYSLPKFQNQK